MTSDHENPEDRPITIFDTTLRDGEQSPGASMTIAEKIEIALALKELGVDVIEAGFPISSPDDFLAVVEIARSIRGATICALARCRPDDIDRAWEAVQLAEDPRIHVFLGTSKIHMEARSMSPARIIRMVRESVARAKQYCSNIEFSPEDAFRTEHPFLKEVVEAAIEEGATTVNIPDTVGYAMPSQIQRTLSFLQSEVPNIDQAVISVHCHNDLGLAVANSLAAVEAGAGQVECTINGIGERAGNCSLEEVVMAMQVRRDILHARTRINRTLIVPTSQLVQRVTFPVQRNKAVVGINAFAHEAGIHQDGFLKDPATYEIMNPSDVGWEESDLILGKHSGMRAVFAHLDKYGLPHDKKHADIFRRRFKEVADAKVKSKEEFTDDDLLQRVYFPTVEEILAKQNGGRPIISTWNRIEPTNGKETVAIITRDDKKFIGVATDKKLGVINALVQGMKKILPETDLPSGGLNVESVGEGSETSARATVTLHNDHIVTRTAEDTNTSKAETDTIIGAFNWLYAAHEYQQMVDEAAENNET